MALNKKIAFIDLKTKKITISPIPDQLRKKYLGGQGLAAYLLHEHAPKGCDPLSAQNVIVVSAGLLSGSAGFPAYNTFITTKSPLNGGLLSASFGGNFAQELRWAGFDHLVILGRSGRPAYLFCKDGKIVFRDAFVLKGMGTSATQEHIRRDEKDDEIQILCTGAAGEKQVRFTHVLSGLKTVTDKPGAGAVFGAKNLKAVACRGSMDIEIKNPEGAISCGRRIVAQIRETGNPVESELLPDQELANDYGIDLPTTKNLINWVQVLFRNGILNEKQVTRLLPDTYNGETVPYAISCISDRKGFCKTLGEGPELAAEIIGGKSFDYYNESVQSSGDDDIKALIKDRALGCLGISPDYDWFLKPKHSVHKDFLELIQLTLGEKISLRRLQETAKRCVAVEQSYNQREGIM